MDKEKEVKRYGEVQYEGFCEKPNGQFVSYDDWKAERTKREEAEVSLEGNLKALEMRNDKIKELEAKLAEAHKIVGTMCDDRLALEAKVKELEASSKDRAENLIQERIGWNKTVSNIESKLATANAKIMELEEWKQGKKGIEDYYELKVALATANKKAEKLVEALGEIKLKSHDADQGTHGGIDECFEIKTIAELALIEYRGEK